MHRIFNATGMHLYHALGPKQKKIDQAHGDPAKPDVRVGLQGQLQWASDFHSTRLSIKTHICC